MNIWFSGINTFSPSCALIDLLIDMVVGLWLGLGMALRSLLSSSCISVNSCFLKVDYLRIDSCERMSFLEAPSLLVGFITIIDLSVFCSPLERGLDLWWERTNWWLCKADLDFCLWSSISEMRLFSLKSIWLFLYLCCRLGGWVDWNLVPISPWYMPFGLFCKV